jgi:hypothetical protein
MNAPVESWTTPVVSQDCAARLAAERKEKNRRCAMRATARLG